MTKAKQPADAPVVTLPEAVTTVEPTVIETPTVDAPVVTVTSESQVVADASAVESQELPAGVLMLSPSISDNGVEPGTSVTLPDGTVITHN